MSGEYVQGIIQLKAHHDVASTHIGCSCYSSQNHADPSFVVNAWCTHDDTASYDASADDEQIILSQWVRVLSRIVVRVFHHVLLLALGLLES